MSKLWTDFEVVPFASHWRKAIIRKIVDADTIDMVIDIGFDVKVDVRTRLLSENAILTESKADDGVDAWETRGPEREQGLAAKAFAESHLPVESESRIWSFKGGSKGSFGRWLCVILYKVEDGWKSLGDSLLEEGHAQVWTG